MSQNNNKVLSAYDELTQFYNMLDQYKTNSTMGRKTLLALNGGAQWTRDFKNGSVTMNSTCLSHDDFDAFNDQLLYVRPLERNIDYDELVPFDPTTNPQLKSIYEIIGHFHKTPVTYKMDKDARELFKKISTQAQMKKMPLRMMKIATESLQRP